MTDLFAAYIFRLHGARFCWGVTDCMTVVCDWVMAVTAIDPMADLRGLYRDPWSCEQATKAAAGAQQGFMRDPVGICAPRFAAAGLKRVADPARADLGLVEVDGRTVGALCTGQFWVGLDEVRGATSFKPACVVAAWRVPQ